MYSKGTFRYIDKDKILPALEKRRTYFAKLCYNELSQCHREALLDIADEIGKWIDNIELGMYDFQQGSE